MDIYTDGGCDRNGRADALGAWAFVTADGHEDCGADQNSTNNRAELLAVIHALRYAASKGCQRVTIYTDSQVTMLCALGRYRRKANRDLWAQYDAAKGSMSVEFRWVKGHSGIPGNERADELCSMVLADAEPSPEVAHLRAIANGN